ncbi:hypothetical protein AYO21_11499 [Fonsecaea monophora]|uniref:Major facilitator superfamily (MFS) profile domain-containing protein n=1 Tax=Fonsecaea monophora TaxID=254056 RepID=A0A177EQV9_9EURO|nr:hypothetical protein AYO21_11499 [Fonsecaea monophora]OAG34347.1 hypothetical protein AYO21_11499 [Fonsecaea monophora]
MTMEKKIIELLPIEVETATNEYRNLGISDEDAEFYKSFPEKDRKRLLWKVDMRLIPTLAMLYLISHLDRSNIGNAKIEGLMEDLKLTGVKYNIALSVFFIPYILLEVPSNILLKKFRRPSTYMSILVLSWGIVMTCTGFVNNFGGLVACRFMLGIPEAGFFPAAIYLISRWYTAAHLQTRIALFYCASAFSGACSGLLAFAIAKMDGVGNRPGWAWIFILEGLATVCLGLICALVMPDTPALSSRWLSPSEIRFLDIQITIKEGGRASQEASNNKFRWGDLFSLLTDYKLYLQSWILFSVVGCAYGLKFTMPSITKSMGYTSSQAQLMTIPPYVAGAISAYTFARFSDRFQWRMPFLVGPLSLMVVGFAIIVGFAPNITSKIAPCYVGVFLVCIGQYPCNPAGCAWLATNLAGQSRRAMGLAFGVAFSNLGGILGSYIYLEKEKPGYATGFGSSLALAISAIAAALILEASYKRINSSRSRVSEDEVRSRHTDDELAKLGDRSLLFRYAL